MTDNDLASLLTDALAGVDTVRVEEAQIFQPHLTSIFDMVKQNMHVFDNTTRHQEDLDHPFFSDMYRLCTTRVVNAAGTYVNTSVRYGFNAALDSEDPYEIKRAINVIPSIAKTVTDTFGDLTLSLPEDIESAYKGIAEYNKYLKERFVKSSEVVQPNILQLVDDAPKGNYEKVKLVEGNALLTETLLRFVQTIPRYNERKLKGRTTKEISRYAVEDAASRLINLSDPRLFGYICDPGLFFSDLGSMLQSFNTIFHKLIPYHQNLIKAAASRGLFELSPTIDQVMNYDWKKTSRLIKKISVADFESVVQNEDDVMPENRKETDYFRVRDRLLHVLYETMTQLSDFPNEGDYDDNWNRREKIAKDAIVKAVELKTEMDDVLSSTTARKLRKDKQSDNEFYVGRQGEVGRFMFKREPTPDVKMGDVIGESFEVAKTHLDQVIETGEYPRLMRLSSPGGSVKSNILLIGPYGCGKTELARAVCADKRVVGASVSVAATLTAYMHESVNNVKRVYDAAKQLRLDSRESKPVVLCLDEFDGWFARSGRGWADTDMQQIENILLEVLDGMEDYNGIITMAMTNKPKKIPDGILRRFRYVDVVGQLTTEERAGMLKMYLEKGLPMHEDIPNHYDRWAGMLQDAPGDVVRKVVDELHFSLVPEYIRKYPRDASRIEKILAKRETKKGTLDDRDKQYLVGRLKKLKVITPMDVDRAMGNLLGQPQIRMQIDVAKQVYRDAGKIQEAISTGTPIAGLN